MIDRLAPPSTYDIEHYLLTKPNQVVLKNSIKLFQFKNINLNLIHFTIRIKGGLIFENQKYLSQACFNLLKESSENRTASEMDEILDFYGATWYISVNVEYISIHWIIPKTNCHLLLPTLIDILLNPVFKEENLERFKKKKIKDLEYNELKYSYRANQLMYQSMFEEDTPMGTLLNKTHINELTIHQIKGFYSTCFNASNITVFVAGNIDNSLEHIMNQSFSQIPNGVISNPISNLKVNFNPQLIVENRDDAMQSSFILCKKGVSFLSDSRRDFSFLTTLLGGYFGSRLMQNLREKNGYTYGVQNGSMYFRNESIFSIDCDVKVDKTKNAIEQCFIEMQRLQTEEVSDEEIKNVKRYLQGTVLRDVDGVVAFMKKFAFWNRFGIDENEFEKFMNSLNHINKEMIINCAKTHLQHDDFYTIIVGKY
jgi:zinc protease